MATEDSSYVPPTEVDIAMIKRLIPHRYPFLLVDKVKDIVAGESCVGVKNVTSNEPHFEGHFPQEPVMPGVLIIEAMAQAAAVLVGATLDLADKGMGTYFMSIDKCRFRNKVVPGDVLELHMKTLRGGGKIWKFEGRAIVNGVLCAEAEVMAMLNRTDNG
ncbi:3-hydroxyacyl-ACP dehydratase FabZ [Paracoccus aminophilus]|uniref:3-hydroxyacyl-[acyl-carrier-protein] dehydratase FabZ n=1 Tax=Paracoccus aminophilus JCM 7686 TaxID=1367847 RepID=S5Y9X5_PARAH|nr:3-hydroxyacyl-ACP dehydratase FabZ [Paracoccus aminophilus]AGT08178.1 3-hydroxyacyl-ACP dehydratase [Paracoccus aminophilus JCM 7686]